MTARAIRQGAGATRSTTGAGAGALGKGGTYVCLKAGEKGCPNGKTENARGAELCNTCLAEEQANADCEGPNTCAADGKDTINVRPECTSQFQALLKCYIDAQVKDAGPYVRD